MNNETLIQALRRISCLDNLRCLGCGYEHSCSTHGCAIINEAIQRLETLSESSPADGGWHGEGDGYWNGEIVYDVWTCTQCGYVIDDGTDDPELLPNYCPNCGAKMQRTEAAYA